LRLIVWDFDGTLADSRPLIVAGMEHALKSLGLQDLPGIREVWLAQVGLPVEEGLRRTFEGLEVDATEVLKAYRSFDWLANEQLLQPFPGMSALVHELHGMGVKMAIASSKRTVALQRQVLALGWAACFDPLVTPDDVRVGKPHPESLEICLRVHGLDPGEALMIGDTPFDLEMAQRAGVPSVAVGHGFYGREALLACEPLGFAPDVPALRELLLAMVTP
jgi:HAD superfamily hydrolase (TIGR01509 family)